MATNRSIVLATEHVYHIYNRGVERRHIFTDSREYKRFVDTMTYYQYANPVIRYSKYLQQPLEVRKNILDDLRSHPKVIDLYAYCLMPNHFHFLIRQQNDKGISQYLSNISNSFSKYFNTKHIRVGPLLQGTFKAVLIETDNELLHVSRYIHINPVASLVIAIEKLDQYPWSSFSDYLGKTLCPVTTTTPVLSHFSSSQTYREFVYDQVAYAQTLEKIKHLTFEE